MANEKRLIDAYKLEDLMRSNSARYHHADDVIAAIAKQPTVDAYTEEEVANIIQLAHQLHATNVELEKECAWLKSCLNCKIRKECPRHCGKVVHDCDHWEHGDSTVDAVEVVRCKDCDWYRKHVGSICVNPKCVKSWYGVTVPPDHFCSYGERRNNGKSTSA